MLNVRVYLQPHSTCVFPGRSVAYSTGMVLRAYVSTHSLLSPPEENCRWVIIFQHCSGYSSSARLHLEWARTCLKHSLGVHKRKCVTKALVMFDWQRVVEKAPSPVHTVSPSLNLAFCTRRTPCQRHVLLPLTATNIHSKAARNVHQLLLSGVKIIRSLLNCLACSVDSVSKRKASLEGVHSHSKGSSRAPG